MSIQYSHEDFQKKISDTMDEKKLLALAYINEGHIKRGHVTPEQYTDNCLALVSKLGFGITAESLAQAAKKYQP